MAKAMKSSMNCPGCGMSMRQCKCIGGGWCKLLCGLVTAVLGLLMVWPQGWFTFEHNLGLLVFLFGLSMLWWGFRK